MGGYADELTDGQKEGRIGGRKERTLEGRIYVY